MEDIKRILVLSRSTKHCRKAVHYGIALAKTYVADLYVVHIFHDTFSLEGKDPSDMGTPSDSCIIGRYGIFKSDP